MKTTHQPMKFMNAGALEQLSALAVSLTDKAALYVSDRYSVVVDKAATYLNEKDRGISSNHVKASVLGASSLAAMAFAPVPVAAALAAGAYYFGGKAIVDKARQAETAKQAPNPGPLISHRGLNTLAAHASVRAFYKDQSSSPFPVGEYLNELRQSHEQKISALLVAQNQLRIKALQSANFGSFLERVGAAALHKLQKVDLFLKADKLGAFSYPNGARGIVELETLVRKDLDARATLWDRIMHPVDSADRDAQVREIMENRSLEKKAFEQVNAARAARDASPLPVKEAAPVPVYRPSAFIPADWMNELAIREQVEPVRERQR